MADRIIEKTETTEKQAPRDTVVVHEKEPREARSNTGLIVGLVIVVIVLLVLIFGRGMFGGGSSGSTPSAPTTSGQ